MEMFLASSPSQPSGDFLAQVTPMAPNSLDGGSLPPKMILNGYTRDGWGVSAGGTGWKGVYLKSTDGRAKLPGFLKYLKDRKKAAFGKFDHVPPSNGADDGTSRPTRAILAIPFDQPPLPGSSSGESVDVIFVKYILDERLLSVRKQRPSLLVPPQAQPSQPLPGKKRGFLGNILGAQQRTDTCLSILPTKKKPGTQPVANLNLNATTTTETSSEPSGTADKTDAAPATSSAVIAKFRGDMETFLQDFADTAAPSIRIPISHGTVCKNLGPEELPKVSMDILQYIVHEATEEIGEDMWVASKEPSEYMDVCNFTVYKEGCAPAHVLEDLNKGELPDEIKGQHTAMLEAKQRQMQQKQDKEDALKYKQAMSKGREVEALNQKKRDRRSVDEIQRDIRNPKASRYE